MKSIVHIEIGDGKIEYRANVGELECLGILTATQHFIVSNSRGGGTGRPPGESKDPNATPGPIGGINRAPGLVPRKIG